MIYIGDQELKDAYVGDVPINEIYRGGDLVWFRAHYLPVSAKGVIALVSEAFLTSVDGLTFTKENGVLGLLAKADIAKASSSVGKASNIYPAISYAVPSKTSILFIAESKTVYAGISDAAPVVLVSFEIGAGGVFSAISDAALDKGGGSLTKAHPIMPAIGRFNAITHYLADAQARELLPLIGKFNALASYGEVGVVRELLPLVGEFDALTGYGEVGIVRELIPSVGKFNALTGYEADADVKELLPAVMKINGIAGAGFVSDADKWLLQAIAGNAMPIQGAGAEYSIRSIAISTLHNILGFLASIRTVSISGDILSLLVNAEPSSVSGIIYDGAKNILSMVGDVKYMLAPDWSTTADARAPTTVSNAVLGIKDPVLSEAGVITPMVSEAKADRVAVTAHKIKSVMAGVCICTPSYETPSIYFDPSLITTLDVMTVSEIDMLLINSGTLLVTDLDAMTVSEIDKILVQEAL